MLVFMYYSWGFEDETIHILTNKTDVISRVFTIQPNLVSCAPNLRNGADGIKRLFDIKVSSSLLIGKCGNVSPAIRFHMHLLVYVTTESSIP